MTDQEQFFKLRDVTTLMRQSDAAAYLFRNPEFIECARVQEGWRFLDHHELEVVALADAAISFDKSPVKDRIQIIYDSLNASVGRLSIDDAALVLLAIPELLASARVHTSWRNARGEEQEILARVDAELALQAINEIAPPT